MLGRQAGRRTRADVGYDYLHIAVDDCSRVAYLQVHPDESTLAATGFIGRALGWFADHGVHVERVMTDNGPCYTAGLFGQALATARVTHKRTRPYRPQTNGKVERFNQTLLAEWASARPTSATPSAWPSCRAGCMPTTTTDPTPR